jgi:hypothetical protein
LARNVSRNTRSTLKTKQQQRGKPTTDDDFINGIEYSFINNTEVLKSY